MGVCKVCRRAADALAALVRARRLGIEIRPDLDARTRDSATADHGLCLGPSHCVCQHRMGSEVES